MPTPTNFNLRQRNGDLAPGALDFPDLSVSNATQWLVLDPTRQTSVIITGTAASMTVSAANDVTKADLEHAGTPWATIATAVGRVDLPVGYSGIRVATAATTGTLNVRVLQVPSTK